MTTTYVAVTKNNEVYTKDEVVIECTTTEEVSNVLNYNLAQIDAQITGLTRAKAKMISDLDAQIAALNTLRDGVDSEAAKVTLKK